MDLQMDEIAHQAAPYYKPCCSEEHHKIDQRMLTHANKRDFFEFILRGHSRCMPSSSNPRDLGVDTFLDLLRLRS